MTYRITTQHNKSDSEQNIVITNIEEDAKKRYLDGCKNDYFTLLERHRCGEWEKLLLNTMMPVAVYCDIHNATLSEVSYLIKNMTTEEI